MLRNEAHLTHPVTYLFYHLERLLLLALVAILSDWLHQCINIKKTYGEVLAILGHLVDN